MPTKRSPYKMSAKACILRSLNHQHLQWASRNDSATFLFTSIVCSCAHIRRCSRTACKKILNKGGKKTRKGKEIIAQLSIKEPGAACSLHGREREGAKLWPHLSRRLVFGRHIARTRRLRFCLTTTVVTALLHQSTHPELPHFGIPNQ
jgi:hypothetical protein